MSLLFQLRQIIEQVIQITMKQEDQFKVKQIVWAKVSDYPWWPGRIVETQKQRNQNVHRVHFFGDPSYCYLYEQHLLHFQSGLVSLKEQFPSDFKLFKPLQLAKNAFTKSSSDSSIYDESIGTSEQQPLKIADMFEESKTETKPILQNIEKFALINPDHQSLSQNVIQQKNLPLQINCGNVLEILSSPFLKQLNSRKGYNNRKQLMTLKDKLKQKLLEKYSLEEIMDQQNKQCPYVYKKFRRTSFRLKKIRKPTYDFNLLLVRKLNKVIQQYVHGVKGQRFATKIFERMKEVCGLKRSGYRKMFKAIIIQLNSTNCQQPDSFETIISRITGQKKEQPIKKQKIMLLSEITTIISP